MFSRADVDDRDNASLGGAMKKRRKIFVHCPRNFVPIFHSSLTDQIQIRHLPVDVWSFFTDRDEELGDGRRRRALSIFVDLYSGGLIRLKGIYNF
jgi:hypothetical protein